MSSRKFIGFLIVFIISSSILQSQDLSIYLIARWNFDDSTARDVTGHGYNGVLVNSPKPVPGVNGIGTAFEFTGKNNYILDNGDISQIGSHVLLPDIDFKGMNEFTITMWVKEYNMSYLDGEAYLWYGNVPDGWLGITHGTPGIDSTLYVEFSVGSLLVVGSCLKVNYDYHFRNRWAFYSIVFKNHTLSCSINNIIKASKSEDVNYKFKKGAIGRHWWYEGSEFRTSARFFGLVDDLRIYKKALDDSDLVHIYNENHLHITSRSNYLCDGDTMTLYGSDGYLNYDWSTGEKTKNIIISKPGSYYVSAVNKSGDTLVANYVVSPASKLEPVIISSNNKPCENDTVLLSLDKNYSKTLWSTGDTSKNIKVISSGRYSVRVNENGFCEGYKEIDVIFNKAPQPKILATFSPCTKDSTFLEIQNIYSKIIWSTGENTSKINIKKDGRYSVTVLDSNGCTGVDQIDVSIANTKKNIVVSGIDALNIVNFDSITTNKLSTKYLLLINISDKPITFNNLYLKNNISFSIPQSQFPITIQPGDSAILSICFLAKSSGLFVDSLIIDDGCSISRYLVKGFGLPNSYYGESGCNMGLIFNSQSTNNANSEGYLLSPNPAFNEIQMPFTLNANELNSLNLKIFNQYGISYIPSYTVETIEISSNQLVSGIIKISLTNLKEGVYFLNFYSYDFSKCYKFLHIE